MTAPENAASVRDCNGQRDCIGTEKGCDHCDPYTDPTVALREKVEARIPGFRKIVQDAKDSGDPDRIAEGAFLLGMFDEISDYVGALRELADGF